MNAKPDPTATGPLALPRVASGRFTVKVASGRGRFNILVVGWLPSEQWFCTGCDTDTKRRPCVHVTTVRDAITPGATP